MFLCPSWRSLGKFIQLFFLHFFMAHYTQWKLWLTLCLSAAWLSNKFLLQLLEFYRGLFDGYFFGIFAWLRINLDESKWGIGNFFYEIKLHGGFLLKLVLLLRRTFNIFHNPQKKQLNGNWVCFLIKCLTDYFYSHALHGGVYSKLYFIKQRF